ncbi:MAG: chitobiase/beta-hexosaminidase C-terminal domain-containing protein, partial [Kiritimatiellae bacterium]|nr:chitobiase/beta-hexosaminidase C-terminal domain-containing protein [Kiritimatiellia bacterium]
MEKTISICLTLPVLFVSTSFAATLCSSDSAPARIDLTTGTRTARLTETIRYSTTWETNGTEGVTTVVFVNGEEIVSEAGSGAIEWRPTRNGTYTFTHNVLANGVQIGETLTATFEMLLGPQTPSISPSDGTVFDSLLSVSISCVTEGAAIHYTTDGSEPTENSSVYRRFRISGRTTVKAIAVKDGLCSEVAVAEYAEGVCETPVIAAQSSFTGSKTPVTLSCATDGATIRYTLDGTEPCATSDAYTETFFITDSCTIKAKAFYPDFFDSTVTTQSITKVWGIGDTVGAPDHAFATGGDLPFVRVTDNTAPLGESMKSGAITHSQTSTLSTTVMGPGTICFQWKASCEDSGGEYDWDHAEFWVDDTRTAQLDGETAWQTVTQAISGTGSHTLLWKYVKDNMSSEGEDCCW